jgi:arabinose-5-phosphate isomerase
MIKSIAEAANVLHEIAFDPVLAYQIESAASNIYRTQQKSRTVITTGMGKAGHIARKFSATLSSMGIPSHYVHPGEAAHGDLGQINPWDLIVALSTSGKTVEVIEFLRQVGDNASVGISTYPENLNTDTLVKMPVMQEADEFDLVPTTSTTVMLAICDAISLKAGELTGFTKKVFADRHHGGYLGQKARNDDTGTSAGHET